MSARQANSSLADAFALCRYAWIQAAQHRYGFDLATAQRLAFVCWLRLTGRLSDW